MVCFKRTNYLTQILQVMGLLSTSTTNKLHNSFTSYIYIYDVSSRLYKLWVYFQFQQQIIFRNSSASNVRSIWSKLCKLWIFTFNLNNDKPHSYRSCNFASKIRGCSDYRSTITLNPISHLFIDRLIGTLRRSAVSVAVLLAGPRRRVGVTIRGLEERAGTRGIVLAAGRFAAGFASRQRRRVLTRGWRDRLPAFYQLHDLVGFPGEVAVRSERIVPAAVRTEIRRTQLSRPVQCN